MPLRREADRKKLEHELSVFLAKGGEITKLKITVLTLQMKRKV